MIDDLAQSAKIIEICIISFDKTGSANTDMPERKTKLVNLKTLLLLAIREKMMIKKNAEEETVTGGHLEEIT